MLELLPCPFCGGGFVYKPQTNKDIFKCIKCGCKRSFPRQGLLSTRFAKMNERISFDFSKEEPKTVVSVGRGAGKTIMKEFEVKTGDFLKVLEALQKGLNLVLKIKQLKKEVERRRTTPAFATGGIVTREKVNGARPEPNDKVVNVPPLAREELLKGKWNTEEPKQGRWGNQTEILEALHACFTVMMQPSFEAGTWKIYTGHNQFMEARKQAEKMYYEALKKLQ